MIREFKASDTEALINVWRRASDIAHPFLSSAFLDSQAPALRDIYFPNAETWTVELNARPVGFIALIGSEIGGLFLDPDIQRSGWGHKMVDHALALKGDLHVEVFEKNNIGRSFYNQYGFVETHRYIHELTGETAIKMHFIAS
ncbi:GNAT family N-acetyltransferase [Hirschia litorea]|uniref:GNAT family N-acetyltransferase n=1 Tax=Hirschia litorea TaxID=1199156 RepID=A0ABW2INK1_9PROT